MTKRAKLAIAVVVAVLLGGLVYEIGFNADDAFIGIVVAGFVAFGAGLVAIICLADLFERRKQPDAE